MFLEELVDLYQQVAKEPVAFIGGVVAGVLRLDLKEEPLASWLKS